MSSVSVQLSLALLACARANYCTDEPSRYTDAPISLQLVGRRYEEEKLIEALEMITEVASLPFAKEQTVSARL
jgi:Asp-tRNA(Asn)/Glu-tRNA(Gln) amidotransferase A subunit family amidase